LKILMMCPYPLKRSLGGAKVYIENAENYRLLGHEVDLVGGDELTNVASGEVHFIDVYGDALFNYIVENGEKYDVIEYEYLYLGRSRIDLPQKPLLVARAVLLELHLLKITIPKFKTLRSFLGTLLKGKKRKNLFDRKIKRALLSLSEADAITVANSLDKEALLENSIPEVKVVVAPYGISQERLEALKTKREKQDVFRVGFVGTFDPRKGAVEFPHLWSRVLKAVPTAKLKLMGTSSMFPNAEAVKSHFPLSLRESIEVVESFNADELPDLLRDCSCGVFPSHLESFGFGVLEMMAASLPVAAYDTPGPEMLLPRDWLAQRGDYNVLASTLISWAKEPDKLERAQGQALELSSKFDWPSSCEKALAFYSQRRSEIK